MFPYIDDKVHTTNKTIWFWVLSLCMFAFILCIALCATPLQRMANISFLAQVPISNVLTGMSAWLPSDFHMLQDIQRSRVTTGNGEFLLLVAFAYVLYGLCAWIIRYKISQKANYTLICSILGVSIGAAALIFIFTPSLPSLDLFIYADYGRTILVHHSNPYFVPPLQSSGADPLTQLDKWNAVVNTYGPLWLYICSFFSLFLGDVPVHYLFAFRAFGLLTHGLNIVLIVTILRAMGQSQRTIALAILLYGCNPLVLLESCLDAHNDACMITFILLGIWLSLRAELKGFTRIRGYAPPLLALTMAVLVKFTSTPLIILFIFLLMRKTLMEAQALPLVNRGILRWRHTLRHVCIASVLCSLTVLLFYAPFWIGHSISAIARSFSLAPSSYFAENSIMRVFVERMKLYGLPPHSSWLYRPVYSLSHRIMWDRINAILLIGTLSMGGVLLWRAPTTRSMVLAALIIFEGVLIVTPWFYPWYVLWIIALTAPLLAEQSDRKSKIAILFAFVFSVSAFFTYIMPYYLQPFDSWLGTRELLTDGPPVVVLLCFLVPYILRRKRIC